HQGFDRHGGPCQPGHEVGVVRLRLLPEAGPQLGLAHVGHERLYLGEQVLIEHVEDTDRPPLGPRRRMARSSARRDPGPQSVGTHLSRATESRLSRANPGGGVAQLLTTAEPIVCKEQRRIEAHASPERPTSLISTRLSIARWACFALSVP